MNEENMVYPYNDIVRGLKEEGHLGTGYTMHKP